MGELRYPDRLKSLGLVVVFVGILAVFSGVKGDVSFVDERYFVFEGETETITLFRHDDGLGDTVLTNDCEDAGITVTSPGDDFETNVNSLNYDFDNTDDNGMQLSVTDTVTAKRDAVANEGIECFEMAVTIGNDCDDEEDDPGIIPTASICIIDRTARFYIEEAQYIIKERETLTFYVRRDGYIHDTDTDRPTVDITFTGITATETVDYTYTVTQLTFDPGEVSKAVDIVINPDLLREEVEVIEIAISDETGFSDVSVPSTSLVYILDETAWFYIEEAQYIVGERDTSIIVRLRRDGHLYCDTDPTIKLITMPTATDTAVSDTDYTAVVAPVTATFQDGEEYHDVTVTIASDNMIEGLEWFTIAIDPDSVSDDDDGALSEPSQATVYILDQTTYFYIEEAIYLVDERTSTLQINVRRAGYLMDDQTIQITVAGVTATGGNDDYNVAAVTMAQFVPNDDLYQLMIDINQDTEIENLESFTVTLDLLDPDSSPATTTLQHPMVATVYIMDRSAHFFMEESHYVIGERSATHNVRIRRDGYLSDAVSFDVKIVASPTVNPATRNADWMGPADGHTVDFAPGDLYADLSFTIVADAEVEDTECFEVSLEPAYVDGIGSLEDSIQHVEPLLSRVCILDETTRIYIEEESYLVKERSGTLTFRIRRDGYLWDTGDVEIDVKTTDGTASDGAVGVGDFTAFDMLYTFVPGKEYLDVTLTYHKDNNIEDMETLTIEIHTPLPSATAKVVEPSTATVYIVDETAVFWIEEAQYIAREGIALPITVHRSGYVNDADKVSLSASNGVAVSTDDYELPVTVDIIFSPGETSHTSDPIDIKADNDIEDTEEFTITLTLDATTMTEGVLIAPAPATVFIFDRTSYFWIEEKQYLAVEGDMLEVWFHRGGYLGRTDTLTLSATNGRAVDALVGDDYSLPADPMITFTEGVSTASKMLTIESDNIRENWEDFSIAIQYDNPMDDTGMLYSPSTSSILIRDPTWYEFECADYTVWESGTSVMINVLRHGDVTTTGSVEISTADGTATAEDDYTGVTPALTVEFGLHVASVPVEIFIATDDLVEKDEVLFLKLANPGDGEALGLTYKATLTIFDDDANFGLEKSSYHLDSKSTTLTVVVVRSGYTGARGTVEISTNDISALSGSDYTSIQNFEIEFLAGETSMLVSITILNDGIIEHAETVEWFEVSLSNPTQGEIGASSGCANVLIEGDDHKPISGWGISLIIACLVAILIIVLLAMCCYYFRQNRIMQANYLVAFKQQPVSMLDFPTANNALQTIDPVVLY